MIAMVNAAADCHGERRSHDDGAVASHERSGLPPEALGQGAAERRGANQHIRHPPGVSDLEDRRAVPEECTHVIKGSERHRGHAEWDD